jgi:hypothetical protein
MPTPSQLYVEIIHIIPTLQMKKLSLREVENLIQDHTAGKWQSWGSSKAIWLQSPRFDNFTICSDVIPPAQGCLMLHGS